MVVPRLAPITSTSSTPPELSPVRIAMMSSARSPSSRALMDANHLSDGASAHCASSTMTSRGSFSAS